jgi:hypothetical protein
MADPKKNENKEMNKINIFENRISGTHEKNTNITLRVCGKKIALTEKTGINKRLGLRFTILTGHSVRSGGLISARTLKNQITQNWSQTLKERKKTYMK